MVTINHEPQPQPLKVVAQEQEGDEEISVSNRQDPHEPQHYLIMGSENTNVTEPSGDDSFSSPATISSLSAITSDTQRATDVSNRASRSSETLEIGSSQGPVPLGATASAAIELLPPVFTSTSNSAANIAVDDTASETPASELGASINHIRVTQATTTTTTGVPQPAQNGDDTLAVAEIVGSRATSFTDFGDDLEDQIEDRAIQIARRVLNEIRMETVQADEMTITDGAGDASVTIATEPQDQQSAPKPETQSNKELVTTSVQRRRIQVLLGVVAILGVVVIALVVVLVTRNDKSSSNTALASAAPAPVSAKCSFCAGGGSSSYSMAELRKIPVGSQSTMFPTCADIYLYQQGLSSTDLSCPVLQAMAYYYYCGCQTVPEKPKNATCTACPNGAVATGALNCDKVDTFITVVGSSLFYFENCAYLASNELYKHGCTCPHANTTTSS